MSASADRGPGANARGPGTLARPARHRAALTGQARTLAAQLVKGARGRPAGSPRALVRWAEANGADLAAPQVRRPNLEVAGGSIGTSVYYVAVSITLAIISAASGNLGPRPGPLLLHT